MYKDELQDKQLIRHNLSKLYDSQGSTQIADEITNQRISGLLGG